MAANRALTGPKRSEALSLLAIGVSANAVAKQFGISPTTAGKMREEAHQKAARNVRKAEAAKAAARKAAVSVEHEQDQDAAEDDTAEVADQAVADRDRVMDLYEDDDNIDELREFLLGLDPERRLMLDVALMDLTFIFGESMRDLGRELEDLKAATK